MHVLATFLLAVAAPGVLGQALTDVPNLTTATLPTGVTSSTSDSSSSSSSTITSAPTTNTAATTTAAGGPAFTLTNAPTIAGAGVPQLYIPYTADAPFMQKSSLPEGTVFIAVGATLAFLGVCVLLWRGLVAWSINRSVKQAAMASLRRPEKANTWATSNSRTGGGLYKEYEAGSSMSLDALTSAGKPLKSSYRDHDNNSRGSTVPPAGLFFSPTANAQQRNSAIDPDGGNRSSTHLPAGYYASPSAARPAGGAGNTTIGGSNLAPYARQSMNHTPSPPMSPNLAPTAQGYYRSASPGAAGLRSGPRERLPSTSRERFNGQTSSVYRASSGSNLRPQSSVSHDQLGGQRAPSAYLDDLFDNHGTGPRDRH